MKLVPIPITNSSNFNIAVAFFRQSAPYAHELAYVASLFFGSPVVKVTLPTSDVFPDNRMERVKQKQKKDIMDSLQILSPRAVKYLPSSLFPSYEESGYTHDVYIVSPPDVLRFDIPEAGFQGVYKSSSTANWKAYTERGVLQCGMYSTCEVNVAVLDADEITKGTPPELWYKHLVRLGVAPRELLAFTEKKSDPFALVGLSKKTRRVKVMIGSNGGVLCWEHRRSEVKIFVPLIFHESTPTNDLEYVGHISNKEEIWHYQ